MLVRLLPIVIIVVGIVLILLARSVSKKKGDALLLAAGLNNAPQGPSLKIHGQKRESRVVDGVYVAVAKARTVERQPVTVIGTHRPHEGTGNTMEKTKVSHALHLWIVFPEPYPADFSFSAGPGEEPFFEGEYEDMAELLSSQEVALPAQSLQATLGPLNGEFRLDNTMLEITLPQDAEITPLILSQTLDLWRAVRDGSEYPYRAQ